MDIPVIVLSGVLLMGILLILQVYSSRKLRRQSRLMLLQGQEIEKQIRELAQQKILLANLHEEKHRVVSVISHDLKGPFNRVFALGQLLLLSGDNFTEEQQEYLGKIHQVVADGLNMLRNLLDYRKMEERGIQLSPEPLNVTATIAAAIRNYTVIADKKKIILVFDASLPVSLVTDKTCLTRIADNLLSNAIKFSPPEKTVRVAVVKDGDHIELRVKDEGPGLAAGDQEKLYQKYQRLNPRPTGGETSTGLGLYLTRAMVLRMNGEIACKSEEGQGATFIVRLPALVG